MSARKVDLAKLVEELTAMIVRGRSIPGGPHAYNSFEDRTEKHVERVLRQHGVTGRRLKRETFSRECSHPDCTNHISDRNKSGICTQCWNERPDFAAKKWEQVTAANALTMKPKHETITA